MTPDDRVKRLEDRAMERARLILRTGGDAREALRLLAQAAERATQIETQP